MAYIIPFILLFIYKMVGKIVIDFTKLKKTKNEIVYGFFTYMGVFFIISGFFALFHVSWMIYYIIMISYNILIIIMIIFYCWKNGLTINFSFQKIGTYISENWIVCFVAMGFTLMYFLSYSGIRLDLGYNHAPAIIDDVVYIARATKNIGAAHIQMIDIQAFSGHSNGANPSSMIAYLELFWAFGSTVFKVDILTFVRTSVAIMTYIIFFATIDELLFATLEKDIYDKKGKFALFGMLSMYLFNNMQFETYKFMYLPWFGNNFSTIIFLPALLLFLLHSLKNRLGLIFMALLVLLSVGYTPVSILYTGIFGIPVTLIWYKYKQYEIKNAKSYMYVGIIISLVFLIVSTLISSFGYAPFQLQNILRKTQTTELAELYFYLNSFKGKAFLIFPGILLYFYRVKNKKINTLEKGIVGFLLIIAFVSLIPVARNIIFNIFSFPYRRLLESILLCLVMYTIVQVVMCFSKINFIKMLCIAFTSIIIAQYSSGIHLIYARNYFSINNLFNTRRTLPITDMLAEYLNTIPGDKYICLVPDRIMAEKNNDFYIDIGIAVSENSTAYLNCSKDFIFAGNGYLVISANAEIEMPEDLIEFASAPIKKLETDDLDLLIYKLDKQE
jgi:hypothetical protein